MTHTDGPSTGTPAETEPRGKDPRPAFTRSVAIATPVIDGTRRVQLHDPTPSGMDVRALLEHLVMVLRRVAWAGRGEPIATWPAGAPDVADDAFGVTWRAAADDVDTAWRDPALLDRPTEVPWGTFSGAEVLGVYTNEVTVHTWDLAQATGQEPAWDDAVLAIADAAIHAQLPVADRAAMWAAFAAQLPPGVPWAEPFGPAVEVPPDAPLIDRLVAWNGRDPRQ
jgi:uncharacterized protein (TIGR03086 family)